MVVIEIVSNPTNMRRIILPFLALGILSSLSSCQEEETMTTDVDSIAPEIIDQTEPLLFSTHPQSPSFVTFYFPAIPENAGSQSSLFLLNSQGDTLATGVLENFPPRVGDRAASLAFDFIPEESYELRVDLAMDSNTIFRYELPTYTHVFESQLQSQTLAEFNYIRDFDLTPQRDYLFFNRYKGSEIELVGLDLTSGNHTIIEGVNGASVRALDRDNLLYVNSGITVSEITKHTISSGVSVPFGQTRANMGDLSRVVDNHLVFSNPIEDGNRTLTIVNLDNYDRRIIEDFAFGNRLRPEIIGQLTFGNSILDPQTGLLSEELSPFVGTSLIQFFPDEDLVLFRQSTLYQQGDETVFSGIALKKVSGEVVFETEKTAKFDTNYIIPSESQLQNNTLLIYKSYTPSTETHWVSGFYRVDLATGAMALVQSDTRVAPAINGMVQLSDNHWLIIYSNRIELLKG